MSAPVQLVTIGVDEARVPELVIGEFQRLQDSGLVRVFSALGLSSGASNTQAIALGIAEALNATVFGLSIAVPTLIGFSYFSKKVEVMSAEIETLVVELISKCYYGRVTRDDAAPVGRASGAARAPVA